MLMLAKCLKLIMLKKDKSILQNFDEAIQNMNGWKQMVLVVGVVHPSLDAIQDVIMDCWLQPSVPPAERMVLVSKLDETIVVR